MTRARHDTRGLTKHRTRTLSCRHVSFCHFHDKAKAHLRLDIFEALAPFLLPHGDKEAANERGREGCVSKLEGERRSVKERGAREAQ